MSDPIREALAELVGLLTDVPSDTVPHEVFVAYCMARDALAEHPPGPWEQHPMQEWMDSVANVGAKA